MPVDAFSITQNGKRTISFMSQALGLMADADIGTENLRWMGDARFFLGVLRGSEPFFDFLSRWVAHNQSIKSFYSDHAPCKSLINWQKMTR